MAAGALIQPLPIIVKTFMLSRGIHLAGEQLARPRHWNRVERLGRGRMTVSGNEQSPGQYWSECIVAIAQRRDRERFAELFAYFAPRLKSFFLRMGVTAGAAEDLAQDTMLAVWNKAAQFDGGRASASTWIFTIARNLRIDMKRRERDPNNLAEFFETPPDPLPSETLVSREQEACVRRALLELPEEQAMVIRLSFFDDRAHGEIAHQLNIPLGTVKSRIRLAMGRLRALVEGQQ